MYAGRCWLLGLKSLKILVVNCLEIDVFTFQAFRIFIWRKTFQMDFTPSRNSFSATFGGCSSGTTWDLGRCGGEYGLAVGELSNTFKFCRFKSQSVNVFCRETAIQNISNQHYWNWWILTDRWDRHPIVPLLDCCLCEINYSHADYCCEYLPHRLHHV